MNNVQLTGRPCECGVIEWLCERVEFYYIRILKYDEHAANSLKRQFYSKHNDYCEMFDWWVNLTPKQQRITENNDMLFNSKCRCSDILFKMESTFIEIEQQNEINIGYV